MVIDYDIFLDYRPIKLQNPSSQGKAGCSSKSNKITCTKKKKAVTVKNYKYHNA